MKSEEKGSVRLLSVPFVYKYMDKVNFMVYYSYYTAKEEQDYKQQAILGGIEYKIRPNISFMPNIIYNDYYFPDSKLFEKDIVSRMTLTYSFN